MLQKGQKHLHLASSDSSKLETLDFAKPNNDSTILKNFIKSNANVPLPPLFLGIDIGSTTAKITLLDRDKIIAQKYERHYSKVRQKAIEIIHSLRQIIGERELKVALSGSAGFGIAKAVGIDFIQEVFATAQAVKFLEPDTDAVIELGGEDAKILFLSGGSEERMNGSCAGGTGAFIDQMVTLLAISPQEFDEISLQSSKIYPVASRCGVFAKTDVQPLLNQGVKKADIAASIFQAVVNQTIGGLAQGRKIGGKVLFLGGPLFFYKGLQERFAKTLQEQYEKDCKKYSQNSQKLGQESKIDSFQTDSKAFSTKHTKKAKSDSTQNPKKDFTQDFSNDFIKPFSAVFPSFAQYAVSIGVARCAMEVEKTFTCQNLLDKLEQSKSTTSRNKYLKPLFENQNELDKFIARHDKASLKILDIDKAFIANNHSPIECYLGIDCGSTTTKIILLDKSCNILYQYYNSNEGNPASVICTQLKHIYRHYGAQICIRGSAVTGYGEELIKSGFNLDAGIVETMAHLQAAQFFNPKVDFIIDIGGQDMKCFYIRNGTIDSIMLNEACSSGCGSFIETFARSMGYGVSDFASLGLTSKHPVELGSRCTVFMNSSVKEAQKEGASIEDISAGLSMSVVKNAIYKVIRARDANDLGQQIVVQGGTFLNNAVLRSFEKEIGRNVVRPQISGLMGAFGAALYAKSLDLGKSSILSENDLEHFTHSASATNCKICGNNCHLTINKFSDSNGGRKFISGNRCEKPLGIKKQSTLPNMYEYKLNKLKDLIAYRFYENPRQHPKIYKGKIGIPLGLNMYENLPFWHKLFSELGFEVVVSPISSHSTYAKGQYSIPSDTVCYPAKLMHGHIEDLLEQGVEAIFYPCMGKAFQASQNECDSSTKSYNCPVVAYYPELLANNVDRLKEVRFYYPYFGLHKKDNFYRKSSRFFGEFFSDFANAKESKNSFKSALKRTLKSTIKTTTKMLGLKDFHQKELKSALDNAYTFREEWLEDIRARGEQILEMIKTQNLKAIILCGRPYHIDPQINHGIDKLINSLGLVVLSEDTIAHLAQATNLQILNQWSYHSRLYNAAQFVCENENIELVQLVSFGCGIDSITTDEVREILESKGRFYTQLKIDEISNLGAVKIRIRSLIAAMEIKNQNIKKPSPETILKSSLKSQAKSSQNEQSSTKSQNEIWLAKPAFSDKIEVFNNQSIIFRQKADLAFPSVLTKTKEQNRAKENA
ncbi:acyl-CoA dehydratase activase [Helicobacter sp. T3_23-1056]